MIVPGVFKETLVPYEWDSSWMPAKVTEMIDLLNAVELPEGNPSCENCAYAHQRTLKDEIPVKLETEQSGKNNTRKKQCPECGSKNLMPIVYGLIDDPDAINQIENGEFAAGGCCVEEDSPKWRCRECKKEFGRVGLC